MSRPTVAEIDLDALQHNFCQVRSRLDTKVKILAVVKANAYGHGAPMISRELERLGVDFLGVATCEEGIALRRARIRVPLIILGGILLSACNSTRRAHEVVHYRLTPVVYNLESAYELSRVASKRNCTIPIHFKVDTGMGRIGILPAEAAQVLQRLGKLRHLSIEGILTHLADNTNAHRTAVCFTRRQVRTFSQLVEQLHKMKIRHYRSDPDVLQSGATRDYALWGISCTTIQGAY